MKRRISIYDTTLRDGSQGEGVNFSLQDKLAITQRLDALGVDFIEGGYPLSNPKDAAYFQQVRDLKLKHARVSAFGMTRKRDIQAKDDIGLRALVDAGTTVVTLVGKTWDLHATEVLGVSLDENLKMIRESVEFLRSQNREVIYDAEHFFDGYKNNPEYALRTLKAAAEAGASVLVSAKEAAELEELLGIFEMGIGDGEEFSARLQVGLGPGVWRAVRPNSEPFLRAGGAAAAGALCTQADGVGGGGWVGEEMGERVLRGGPKCGTATRHNPTAELRLFHRLSAVAAWRPGRVKPCSC